MGGYPCIMHLVVLLASLLFLVSSQPTGDGHCIETSVCPSLDANVKAILDARSSLGCCSHDACVPFPDGSTKCSVKLATSLEPCMLKDYAGDRAGCVTEVVGVNAPDVCGNMWLRCDAMESLTKYLELAQAVSGCPTREGAVSFSAVFESILAAPLEKAQSLSALAQQGLDEAAAVASPILNAAAAKLPLTDEPPRDQDMEVPSEDVVTDVPSEDVVVPEVISDEASAMGDL